MPYVTLVENKDWLKPVGEFASAQDEGVTQTDVTRAEGEAKVVTDATVGWMYDTTDWETTPPPIIELANKYLASAITIDYFLSRDTDVTVGEEYMPDKLWDRGMALLQGIVDGKHEVTDASGTLVERLRVSPRKGPMVSVGPSRFFPERNSQRSFGVAAAMTGERVFKKINT